MTPLGVGVDALHDGWKRGISGLRDGLGLCRDFEPTELLSRKEARRMERFTQLAVAASQEAIQSAWGGELPYPPERVSCVLGCSFGGWQLLCDQHAAFEERGPDAVWTLCMTACMTNAAPAVLAIRHGFRGDCYVISSACASSAQAIGEGLRKLRSGSADAVVVGGTDAPVSDTLLAAFRAAGALSPSGISRPFDRRRDGFVMAEGAAIMVLERVERAQARGADILGYLAGYGSTTDGFHLAAPEKDGATCALAILQALADAGLPPERVDWVNAHGTSTPTNDRAETMALKAALGAHAYDVPISAPKSVLGHSMGAAGAVEAVAALTALREGVAPPTVGLEEPEASLDLDYVPGSAVPLAPRNGDGRLVAISNSFAFGGHNATLVLTT